MGSIIRNAIGGIIGTIIGGLFLAWMLAPGAPGSLSAHETSIDIPITSATWSDDFVPKLKALDDATEVKGFAEWLIKLTGSSRVGLHLIELQNTGSTRTDPIEISVPGLKGYEIFHVSESPTGSSGIKLATNSTVTIDRINPGSKVNFVALVDPLTFTELQVLNGGKIVPVLKWRPESWETMGISALIATNSPGSELFVIVVTFIAFGMIILIGLAAYWTSTPDRNFRSNGRATNMKYLRFADWVKVNKPDFFREYEAAKENSVTKPS